MTRLLPTFGPLRLDRITAAKVHRWFDDYSRSCTRWRQPSACKILRHVLNHAIACHHISFEPDAERQAQPAEKSSPVSFHGKNLADYIACSTAMTVSEITSPSQRQQVDIIRLLLLTGCRKNEIVRLRKQEVAENCLRLLDSKTGPRTVFLNAEARAIIER